MSHLARVAAFAYATDNEGQAHRDVTDHARNAGHDAYRADLVMRAAEMIVADTLESRNPAIYVERLEIIGELLRASRERLATTREAAEHPETLSCNREANDDA